MVGKESSFVNAFILEITEKVHYCTHAILYVVNWVVYQVSSKGLWQDHFLLQFLLNVFCWVNHSLRVEQKEESVKGRVARNMDRKSSPLITLKTTTESILFLTATVMIGVQDNVTCWNCAMKDLRWKISKETVQWSKMCLLYMSTFKQ